MIAALKRMSFVICNHYVEPKNNDNDCELCSPGDSLSFCCSRHQWEISHHGTHAHWKHDRSRANVGFHIGSVRLPQHRPSDWQPGSLKHWKSKAKVYFWSWTSLWITLLYTVWLPVVILWLYGREFTVFMQYIIIRKNQRLMVMSFTCLENGALMNHNLKDWL